MKEKLITIESIVNDEDGNPVENAEIFSGNAYAKTDAGGRFSILTEPGSRLIVEAEGFENISLTTDAARNIDKISLKTAKFLYGSDDEVVDQMKEFGLYCGIAFQIKDDLFDYDRNGKIGKPTANDIQEKKMTLPLIYALQNCSANEKKNIIALIKKEKKSSNQVDQILDFVESHKGLEFAEEKMNEYRMKAIQILKAFPSNAFSKSLIGLVDFTVNRKK